MEPGTECLCIYGHVHARLHICTHIHTHVCSFFDILTSLRNIIIHILQTEKLRIIE